MSKYKVVPAEQPLDLHLFAKRMDAELEKHDIQGFEPVVLAVAEEVLGYEQPPSPDVAGLVEALEQIERWDGFPSTDKTWEGSGEPVSYGAAFGSNGERDFMREVTRKAIAAHRKQQEPSHD